MPEERHLLFERPPRMSHSCEPPSLQLAAVELRNIIRVAEVETGGEQVLHLPIVYLGIVDQELDGSFSAPRSELVDLIRTRSKAHSAEQMCGLFIGDRSHNGPPAQATAMRANPVGFRT